MTQTRDEYRKAAEQGDAAAQYNLGIRYEKGEGIPQDYKEAVKWYRKAAEQGHADAQVILCFMYRDDRDGTGVSPNNILAYAWASLGAMSSDRASVKLRNLIAKKLSPEDLAKGQAEAARLHALIQKNKGE
jgi:TPR repeat protein